MHTYVSFFLFLCLISCKKSIVVDNFVGNYTCTDTIYKVSSNSGSGSVKYDTTIGYNFISIGYKSDSFYELTFTDPLFQQNLYSIPIKKMGNSFTEEPYNPFGYLGIITYNKFSYTKYKPSMSITVNEKCLCNKK